MNEPRKPGAPATPATLVDTLPGGFLERAVDEDGVAIEVFRVPHYDDALVHEIARLAHRMQAAGPAFPKVLAHGVDDDKGIWIRFERVPRLPLRALLDEKAPRGVALPMAVSLVSSLASSLARTPLPHGTPGLDCAAVGLDGSARLHWRPRFRRVHLGSGTAELLYMNNIDTMPPEVAMTNAELSSAIDVYTLGAVLWALVIGRSPFRGDDMVSTLRALVSRDPAPRLVHDAAPPALADVVAAMLRRVPAERMPLADVPAALAAAAPWARWTEAQIADEVRAMLPEEYERLRRP